MSKNLCRLVSGALVVLMFLSPFLVGAEPDKDVTNRFKAAIASKLSFEVGDKKEMVVADTEFVYAWQRKGAERILSFDSMMVRTGNGEKEPRRAP